MIVLFLLRQNILSNFISIVILIKKVGDKMNSEQFNELTNTIKELGTNEVSWIDYRVDYAVALVSAVLAALFAFKIHPHRIRIYMRNNTY